MQISKNTEEDWYIRLCSLKRFPARIFCTTYRMIYLLRTLPGKCTQSYRETILTQQSDLRNPSHLTGSKSGERGNTK